MSAEVMGAVFKRYPVGGGELMLALALADHAWDDGTHIWPKLASLAAKTRQSERAVQYQLRKMEQRGWLQLVNSGDGGRGRSREYRINPGWLNGADLAPFEAEKGCKPEHEKGATGDTKGCKAFAPAIEPSKEPSESNTPHTPQGGAGPSSKPQPAPAKPELPGMPKAPGAKARGDGGLSMEGYLAECKAAGVSAVPEDDPVWRYAAKVRLPDDFVGLAWFAFKRRHLAKSRKRQRDWRQAFRNYVEGNYYGFWLLRGAGEFELSTKGLQEQRLRDADSAEADDTTTGDTDDRT
jgi:hypothetical protein